MKRAVLLCLLSLSAAFAQTDAPPARGPDKLPPMPTPTPSPHGTLKIDFVGNKAFTANQLRDGIARQIQSIEDAGLDAANAYDDAFFIDSFYRKKGYSQVDAQEKITGPWQLQLTIEEGPLTLLGPVTIIGNHAYDTPALTKYLIGPTRERFPRIREALKLPFVEADVQNGAGLVTRLYATDGYLDAVVNAPVITLNESKTTASISLTVKEGIQYHFGEIKLVGPLIFPRATLVALIADETKNVYTDGRVAAAQRKLEDYYKSRGYFTADVEANGDPSTSTNGNVTVVFQLKPGLLFHFDGTVVTGNSGVRASFIQKRMQSVSGKVYDPTLIDEQFRLLLGTGLFRNVRITPTVVHGDQVKLAVNVQEAKPKEFGVGVGYATFDGGILDVNYTDRNLFHNGRPLSLNAEITQRGYSGEILYSDPWLFDSDYALRLRLYALTLRLKGYSKNEIGFNPTLSRQITKHWDISAFLLLQKININNVLIEPESLVGQENYTAFSIGISQTLDYRNNTTLPTSGYIFTTTLDAAPNGLSDISFIRGVARLSYYIPITTKSSLALGARAGIISPLNGGQLPIDENFFNGGATTVRSFSELTLGPRDHQGYPLGGEGFTVFNAEYTFPLIGDLYAAVFVDAGNITPQAKNFGLQDMRYAVGAGLRYNLPIGTVRLDYGLNPDPQPGDAQGAFHFAIGVAF